MKQIISIWLCLLLATFADADAKDFANLHFDDGGYPSGVPDYFQPTESVLPGWTARMGEHIQTEIVWNNVLAGNGLIGVSSKGPLWGPLAEGRYALRLTAGPEYPTTGPAVPASISQVGMVPADAHILTFRGSFGNPAEFTISFGGEVVPYFQLSETPYYGIYGLDVSPFAGRELELRLTRHPNSEGFGGANIDTLTFSSSTVPEASTWALLGVGGLSLVWLLRRQRSGG